MRKLKIILTLVLAFATTDAFASGDAIVILRSPEPEQKGVTLSAVSVAQAFVELAGASLKETYDGLSDVNNEVFALVHSDTMDSEEFAESLKQNPNVIAASPNYDVYLADTLPNESSGLFTQENCWGMYSINAPKAWDISTGSSNVYVAIIDSGIDYTNPDISPNFNEYYSNLFSSRKDTLGHGTHVAGIIGAKGDNGIGLAGVNWNVSLISVNALPNGDGKISDVINAVDFVTKLIKNYGVNIRAVNLSIQTYYKLEPTYENLVRDPLWRAFKALDSLNQTVVVVAAGNQGETVGKATTGKNGSMIPEAGYYVYPASFKGTLNNFLAVGALNKDGTLAQQSNKGADIAAPGISILSTYLQSSSSSTVSTASLTGTSMAAPFVSGSAALLSAINPNLTAYQIKTALMNNYQATLSSSGQVEISSGEKFFNLSDVIEFYESNKDDTSVMPATPAVTSWDNYASYAENTNPSYYESNSGNNNSSVKSGGGGCNGVPGLSGGIFAFMIFLFFLSVAKKIKSC